MFKKKLHLCFFNIKCLPSSSCPPLTLDDEEELQQQQQQCNSDYSQIDIHQKHQPLTIKHFNKSIYDLALPSPTTTTTTTSSSSLSTSSLFTAAASSTNDDETCPPDFSSAFASQRFFVSSPGQSNSILDSSATVPADNDGEVLVGGGVPVKKYSPDPYTDFRRSMQEMIEAREKGNASIVDNKNEPEFLKELLLCYLALNPKHAHKYIIEAFADVLVSICHPMAKLGSIDAADANSIRPTLCFLYMSRGKVLWLISKDIEMIW